MKTKPIPKARKVLAGFADDVYLHQVLARDESGKIKSYRDLPNALADDSKLKIENSKLSEWRIHFHIPLHCPPTPLFGTTADHVQGVLDVLREQPSLCAHLEMETYTWEVMPGEMKKRNVVDQLVEEYRWTLAELAKRGVRPL